MITEASEYFLKLEVIGSLLLDVFELSQPRFQKDKCFSDFSKKINNKIIHAKHLELPFKLRGTNHELDKETLFVFWPALVQISEISQYGLTKEMRHPNCLLADALIMKNVIEQIQVRNKSLLEAKIESEKEKEALDKLAKLKSSFLAMMSHEIRTPLNGILGMSRLLVESDLNEEDKDIVETINSSGAILLKLLNDILDFSKLESSNVVLEKDNLNITSMVNEVLNIFQAMAKDRDVTVEFRNNLKHDDYVGDKIRIQQILNNLLSNAIKFSPKGKKIEIICSSGSINTRDKTEIIFSVVDQGHGISAEEMKNLFQPFSQLSSVKNKEIEGTGLGLTICEQIVRLMGGQIEVKSKKGEGATFEFRLNLVTSNKASNSTKVKDQFDIDNYCSTETKKVLVVDDNKFNRKVAFHTFKKLGFDSIQLESGKKVLDLLASGNKKPKEEYLLIFMDMEMPVMSGIETTVEIISKYKEDAPPILAMTANAFEKNKKACLDAGMVGFITKPFLLEEIRKILKEYAKND